ncbi:helix-turn-helix domain-containing protein [Achromobacter xylosoxidans]|uniref:helix-turn-helix domain-containing protein n=2 Tax=Alcaligenes xylosoxydans xylosoxydans TaxID=85698 RepID=UPI001C9E5683|nr:helix-turn-helix domain-containing protein [Achromobacter xylosoxidans]
MSTIVMSACWPLQTKTPAQKAVLVSLADNANDEGVCWPSVGKIAERTCLSERAVQDAIKWLIKHSAVAASGRTGRSTVYTVTPARYAPPQDLHPRSKRTPAEAAPPQTVHPTPAASAPQPPQDLHPTPAASAPRTVKEPTDEPPGNRQAGAEAPPVTDPDRLTAEQAAKLTKDELWKAGKSLLNQLGQIPLEQCGAYVGKLVKDYGAETVMEAVRQAVVERPAEPRAYLMATCKSIRAGGARLPGGKNRQEHLEERNRQAALAAARGEGVPA